MLQLTAATALLASALAGCGGGSPAVTPQTLTKSIMQYEEAFIASDPRAAGESAAANCSPITKVNAIGQSDVGQANCSVVACAPADCHDATPAYGQVTLQGAQWTFTLTSGSTGLPVPYDSSTYSSYSTTFSGVIGKAPRLPAPVPQGAG